MRDEACIFCKIANGEIPSDTIYEDEDFRVILDLSPISPGHALILPKNHSKNLFELDEDTAKKALLLAKRVGGAMMEALDCKGMNLLQNNGEEAGQTVMHFHIHLIPRYAGDDGKSNWEAHASDPETQKKLAAKIREAVARG